MGSLLAAPCQRLSKFMTGFAEIETHFPVFSISLPFVVEPIDAWDLVVN